MIAAAGFFAGLAFVGLAGVAFMVSGLFNLAADTPHSSLVYWILQTTKVHSIRRQAADIAAPARFTAADVEAGFRLYDAHCIACHGAPGLPPDKLAEGLNPPPPYLIEAPLHLRPNEIFWIVTHGEKMTGMPSWERRLDARERWQLVAFVEALRRTTYADYLQMQARLEPQPRPGPSPARQPSS